MKPPRKQVPREACPSIDCTINRTRILPYGSIFEENDLKEHILANAGHPSGAHLKKSLRPKSKHIEQVKMGVFIHLTKGL